MRARHARLIRIGINARRMPYNSGGNDSDGYYTVLDFTRLHKYLTDWERIGKHNRLSRRAYKQTGQGKYRRAERLVRGKAHRQYMRRHGLDV